jgi:hypothetical protein
MSFDEESTLAIIHPRLCLPIKKVPLSYVSAFSCLCSLIQHMHSVKWSHSVFFFLGDMFFGMSKFMI